MVALRSRRLEGLLGGRLEDLVHGQVESLVTGGVSESYDLDFKGELYGGSDRDKHNLGGDVAAMANTAGGMIVLGIRQDGQARAASAPGVALSDAEVGRVRQIVASYVSPLPRFDVLQIEDPGQPGQGFLVIAVPRSPSAPHAVLVNAGLRFPKRNGATTTYLSEPEVAQAYAARLASIVGRVDQLIEYEREMVAQLDISTQTFVVTTLVPDLPGGFTIDTASWRQFQANTIGSTPLVLTGHLTWQRASVGSQRLVASGNDNPATGWRWLACELRDDGAGCIAVAADRRADDATGTEVDDEDVVHAVWSSLRYLARHARDRAAAGGNASVRTSIWPVSKDLTASLTHGRHGFRDNLGRQAVDKPPNATGVFDIDDLAEDGASVLLATRSLTTGLFQAFGQPETLQISPV